MNHIYCACGCQLTFEFEPEEWTLLRLGLKPMTCLECGMFYPCRTLVAMFKNANDYEKAPQASQHLHQIHPISQPIPAPASSRIDNGVWERLKSLISW